MIEVTSAHGFEIFVVDFLAAIVGILHFLDCILLRLGQFLAGVLKGKGGLGLTARRTPSMAK